jgi:hypothetical protein
MSSNPPPNNHSALSLSVDDTHLPLPSRVAKGDLLGTLFSSAPSVSRKANVDFPDNPPRESSSSSALNKDNNIMDQVFSSVKVRLPAALRSSKRLVKEHLLPHSPGHLIHMHHLKQMHQDSLKDLACMCEPTTTTTTTTISASIKQRTS